MTQILQGHGIAHTPEQVEDDLCRLHDTLASDIESGRVNVDPIPGSFEFMIRLIQRNRYITVITASKAKLAEKVLEKMNVRDGIKHIFSAEDLAKYE